ncbi:MAG: DEAD/DEAH box helicase [Terriglobia bacterium]
MPAPLHQDQVVTGRLFNEPMRVETAVSISDGTCRLGLVGTRTEKFRCVTLTGADLAALSILQTSRSFGGEGRLLRLGIQANSLGIAFEFDPYFGLSVSRVDPLPHQLEAIYDNMLRLPRVRFLLADDAGAGKTIMAGLLLRELKLRGLVERTLVVCPANLTFQWQRELKEKFDEQFLVMRGFELRVQYGVNQWLQHSQIITSLDLAKREDILPSLRQAKWDLVIVDEAHRMSAAAEDKKSMRYRLGELLRDTTDHYVLLTATPHKGDPLNFTLFLRLLDEDAFADVRSIREAMERRRAPFYEALEQSSRRWHEGRQDPWPFINYILFTLKTAYREFEDRVGQIASPRGAKAEMVLAAVRAQTGAFRLTDIERACPGVGREWIRTLLADLKRSEKVTCQGKGPAARWHYTRGKGSTSK